MTTVFNQAQQGDNTENYTGQHHEENMPVLLHHHPDTRKEKQQAAGSGFSTEVAKDPTPHLRSAPTTFEKEEENKGKKDKDGNDLDRTLPRVVSVNHDAAFG